MAATYKIYLVNLQLESKKFWCFLDQAIRGLPSDKVLGNSNAFLTVPTFGPNRQDLFSIPSAYTLGVGASKKPVERYNFIESTYMVPLALEEGWLASYFQNGENRGPILTADRPTNKKDIRVSTNVYDKKKEPINDWNGSMNFGIKSDNVSIGNTWSHDSDRSYYIRPRFNFFITTGSYEPRHLVDLQAIEANAARVGRSNFDAALKCTVILHTDGSWTVQAGDPSQLPKLFNLSCRLKNTSQLLMKISETSLFTNPFNHF